MTNETKPLELLIVEDNEKHLADAQAEINRRINAGTAINATYVTDYRGAQTQMVQRRFDRVISDIFFPSGMENDESLRQQVYALLQRDIELRIERNIESIKNTNFSYTRDKQIREQEGIKTDCLEKLRDSTAEWMEGRTLAPYGVLITQTASEMKIPAVLCTSGHHHGKKYAPVVHAVTVPVIDRVITDHNDYMNYEKESEKNWPKAVDVILGIDSD